jgi:hypothetical protein
MEEERDKRRVEELKKNSNKNYSLIESRYQSYGDRLGEKAEAIANRQIER